MFHVEHGLCYLIFRRDASRLYTWAPGKLLLPANVPRGTWLYIL